MSEEKGNNWKMPKPVFRQSTGHLLKGFADKAQNADLPDLEKRSPDAADEMLATLYAPPVDQQTTMPIVPAIKSAAVIEPQPDISDQFTVDQAFDPAAAKVKPERALHTKILIVLGVLAMIGIAFGFVALIYFLFFYSPPQTNNF